MVFVKLSKAFNRIPRYRLLSKLAHVNIDRNLLAWIKDFLLSRVQFISVDNSNLSSVEVTSRVAHGSLLVALLFFNLN